MIDALDGLFPAWRWVAIVVCVALGLALFVHAADLEFPGRRKR